MQGAGGHLNYKKIISVESWAVIKDNVILKNKLNVNKYQISATGKMPDAFTCYIYIYFIFSSVIYYVIVSLLI